MKIIQLTNMTPMQSMGYVIKAKSGEVIVIDGGAPGNANELERVIKKVGGEVAMWLITHPHYDHFDAVIELLSDVNTEISYKKIGASVLPDSWGVGKKDCEQLYRWNRFVKTLDERFFEIKKGQRFKIGTIDVEIIAGANPEIEENPFNNQSCVFHLTEDDFSILFLGDLGVESGAKIDLQKLKSNAVQMAHHGQRGVEEDFYKAIDPQYAFWPTPKWLWDNTLYLGKGNPGDGDFKTPETAEWMMKIGAKNIFSFENTVLFDTETQCIQFYGEED